MAFANDKKRKEVGFTPEEWKIVCSRAEKLGMTTSAYIARMAVEGQIVKYEIREFNQLLREVNSIGNNVNQIARKANEIDYIYKSDVDELKEEYEKICHTINQYLSNLRRSNVSYMF